MKLFIQLKFNLMLILAIYTGSILAESDIKSHEINSTNTTAPHLFPKEGSQFKIIPVNTIKNLKEIKDASSVSSSSKLQKMLSTPDIKVYKVQNMAVDELPVEFPTDLENEQKNQVEDIQGNDLTHSEVELEERFRHSNQSSRNTILEDIDIEMHPKQKSTIYFPILCGTILIIFIVGILIGYLFWGHYTQRRYGKLQKLLTHDNFYERSTECI